jgi:hypothetical protein
VSDRFRLTRPCHGCPFRTDDSAVRLTRARVSSIERSLLQSTFDCHETTGVTDEMPAKGLAHCAGALILLEKLGRPSQMMRIAERLGMYDRTMLDMSAPVFDSVDEMKASAIGRRRGRK